METCTVRRLTIPMDFHAVEPVETRPTLLLVTGDADLRAVTARVLTREGYHVVTAAHSGHAVLASLTGRIDILVSELELDDTSGPALAATLRRHHPRLRVVYFADAGTPAADGVIVRPFTRDDLVLELDAVGAPVTLAS
jgi:DNA-binding response OmpR family regulator